MGRLAYSTMLHAAAFIGGAAVMVYELLAVRILQRYFGGTVDVWASEIAVCLAGLAIGYNLGGRLADRFPSPRLVAGALIIGGVTGLLVEPLAEWAGETLLGFDYGLVWHPLIGAGVCTFLPFLALGTVMPLAIRLQTTEVGRVGHAAGNIATVSTVGSIAGVLMTSMVLMRFMGVRQILYSLSILLVVLGLLWLPFARPKSDKTD